MKKAIIFDMDGLMIDSERVTYNEYVKKLQTLGYDDFTEEIYKQCLGKNKEGICQVFFDQYGNDFPMIEVWDDVHDWIDESLRKYVPKKKGLDKLLKYLKENHYKIALASSSSERLIDKALTTSGIIDYFDLITSGNSFKQSKPHPEIYLYVIEKLHITKKEALIIEDSTPGIQVAINAGIDVIAVKDDRFSIDQSQANHIIGDIIDVKKYI